MLLAFKETYGPREHSLIVCNGLSRRAVCGSLYPDMNTLRVPIDSGWMVIQGRSERGIVQLIASRDDA